MNVTEIVTLFFSPNCAQQWVGLGGRLSEFFLFSHGSSTYSHRLHDGCRHWPGGTSLESCCSLCQFSRAQWARSASGKEVAVIRSFTDNAAGSSCMTMHLYAWPTRRHTTHPTELTHREEMLDHESLDRTRRRGLGALGWAPTTKPELGAEALRTGSAIITT